MIMKIATFVILIILLLIASIKFLFLSIQTGINSGFNKGLKLEPAEEDIRQEKLWNRWRWVYVALSIITLIYVIFVLW